MVQISVSTARGQHGKRTNMHKDMGTVALPGGVTQEVTSELQEGWGLCATAFHPLHCYRHLAWVPPHPGSTELLACPPESERCSRTVHTCNISLSSPRAHPDQSRLSKRKLYININNLINKLQKEQVVPCFLPPPN